MSRRLLFALIAVAVVGGAGIAVVPALPAGAAPLPSLECGVTPTTDVILRQDLTCAEGFHFGGVNPPVAINLNGHRLTVAGTGSSGAGAILGATSVSYGTVVGELKNIGTIVGVHVRGDVYLNSPADVSSSDQPETIRGSFVDGGNIKVLGSGATIDRNLVVGSIQINDSDSAVRDLSITRNWITLGPGSGITLFLFPANFPQDVSGSIDHNVVWGMSGHGIELGSALINLGDLAVASNTLVANGGDGIHIATTVTFVPPYSFGPLTLSGNIAWGNHGHGIDAEWTAGLVDGGNNKAIGNLLQPKCVNIACGGSWWFL